MVNILSKNPERRLNKSETSENPKEKGESSREIKEKSKEFVEGLNVVVESGEAVETAEGLGMGNVSEDAGEDREDAGSGSSSGTAGTATTVTTDDSLLPPPRIEVMQIQIAVRIRKEIVVLEKEIKKYSSRSNFNPHELTKVISRVRHFREILARLAYESVEVLKGWWLQYVKEKG